MVVHLYAQCWNDEWMLPFFFRHYDRLVDRYFMFDDGSSDGTLPLLRAHPKVEVRQFERSDSRSFVVSEQAFSNQCWKASRGLADWVIVTDVDEHLYHPAGRDYLDRCASEKVTIIPALGFQMISAERPSGEETLCVACTLGAPWSQMLKASVFDPDEIVEVNYGPGRHRADPTGRIRIPQTDELLLFHYKYMGFEETYLRHKQLEKGLGLGDVERNFGHKYRWSRDRLQADWAQVLADAIDTLAIRSGPSGHYPSERWWEKYRQ